MSANHVTFVADNGISLADPPTEDEPSRHRVVRNCRYTLGPVEGRDSECSYCLELMEATDITVTHSGCRNAFHDHCFDHWLATNPNLVTQNPMPSTCPFCNGLLYAWPALVGPLPPAEAATREAARQRAAAEAQRREIRADLQAERAFAETDNRRGLGPEALARVEAHQRADAETERRELLWEMQSAIALAETEGRTLEAEARRRDLRAELQAARAFAETEGRTLGQPVVDREEFLREQAARPLEHMETRAAEQLARITSFVPDWSVRKAMLEQDAQEPDTEMRQEADDALNLLQERFNVIYGLLDIRALYWVAPWEHLDDDEIHSEDDEIPDV